MQWRVMKRTMWLRISSSRQRIVSCVAVCESARSRHHWVLGIKSQSSETTFTCVDQMLCIASSLNCISSAIISHLSFRFPYSGRVATESCKSLFADQLILLDWAGAVRERDHSCCCRTWFSQMTQRAKYKTLPRIDFYSYCCNDYCSSSANHLQPQLPNLRENFKAELG